MNLKLIAIGIMVLAILVAVTVVFFSLTPHNTIQTLSAETGYYREQVGAACIQHIPGGGGTSWIGNCQG